MTDGTCGTKVPRRTRETLKRLRAALPRYFKKGDIMIIAALVMLSVILGAAALMTSGRAEYGVRTYAVITRGGREIARLPLGSDTEYIVSDSDAYNKIVISGGSVYMSEADCPDRICVSHEAISRPGQVIVCLPNRTAVSIVSEDGAEVDSVAY